MDRDSTGPLPLDLNRRLVCLQNSLLELNPSSLTLHPCLSLSFWPHILPLTGFSLDHFQINHVHTDPCFKVFLGIRPETEPRQNRTVCSRQSNSKDDPPGVLVRPLPHSCCSPGKTRVSGTSFVQTPGHWTLPTKDSIQDRVQSQRR